MAQLSLLNTTWTLHRLSPLHHGKEFPSLLDNNHALKTYAARLRDHLTGTSSVSGATFQIGGGGGASDETDPSSASKTGALLSCTWEPIPTLSLSGHTTTTGAISNANPSPSPSPSPSSPSTNTTTTNNNNTTATNDPTPQRPRGRPRRPATTPGTPGAGILITLTYETQTYRAALLTPSAVSSTTPKPTTSPSSASAAPHRTLRSHAHTQTTHLPLLLTKLPAPLRQTLLGFLSATFDTYAAGLTLPSGFLGRMLEGYLSCLGGEVRSAGSGASGSGEEVVGAVVRDVHFMLGFQGPVAPGLRGLDVCVPRGVVGGLVAGGVADQLGGEDVLGKIAGYLDTHLAMRVDLKEGRGLGGEGGDVVRVTRVSCGGFMLGADGKMKLVGVAGAGAGAGAGQAGAEDDDEEDEDERGVPPVAAGATALSLKDRVALRAAEMLLLDVLRRAAGGEGESHGS
ncbi:hypothetical protein BO86DRAFT_453814 [Aspergillus japonicus CBS 114.51]|uniref:Uncharacterized protein n=1 Tax=Aspergillus japonicus CBS 114.51 TaxID=1448312 RepID=A0A8T8XBC0_ASPJA|nr:hypothetical protein BO86DRAFT_453814 [Aspergillus japonicus CBS 114.51]RAH85371.1 hypothetical protein BO86DRAFT_453814 [Aspergillus japonicus CBS 114.51]